MEFAISAFGGILIGLAASLMLVAYGRIAGVSGMVAGLLSPQRGDWQFRVWFVSGLLVAGAVASVFAPQLVAASPRPVAWLAVAGLLVGFGTRLGNGCTSGHGVCGVSRLAPRSIVATCVFVGFGMLTVTLLRWLGVAS
jgi:uncharacterized membrane protein YedE/YeeE